MTSKAPESPAEDEDAIALLMAHRRVAKLFADFKNLKDDGSEEEKAAVVEQICQQLIVHCAIEEEIFYPAIRKAIEDEDLMDEALVEHGGAKELIAQLQAAEPDDELYDAKVTVLGDQVDHHVMEEEGNMFPQARGASVDTEALVSEMLARKSELLSNPGLLTLLGADEDELEERQQSAPSSAARSDAGTRSKAASSRKASIKKRKH